MLIIKHMRDFSIYRIRELWQGKLILYSQKGFDLFGTEWN